MTRPLPRLALGLLFSFLCLLGQAQTHTPIYHSIVPHTNAYYEYLPAGYNPQGTKTYPLILFLHGAGDMGDGSPSQISRLLQVGIPKLISQGNFPATFTVNGQDHSFIVISPQFNQWPAAADAANDVDAILNYI